MIRYGGLLALCASLWLASPGFAQDAAPAEEPDYQNIVETSGQQFCEAFAKQDAAAIAALFTPEAEYVDSSGTVFHGRESIEAEYVAVFEALEAGTLELELMSIRPVADGVMIEEGISVFRPTEGEVTSRSHYSAIHVRQPMGGWLLASVRDLESPEITAHDRLLAMGWLLGKWVDENDDLVIATEWKWSDTQSFLEGVFSVRDGTEMVSQGTHRIGWDAQRQQFRSWVFDAQGGFSEGYWTTDEDGVWTLMLSGVTADGMSKSMLLSYVREGEDLIAVTQTLRVVGGETLPSRLMRVARQPPEPADLSENR